MLIQVSLRKFLSKTFVKLLFADLLKRIGMDDLRKLNYQHSLMLAALLTKTPYIAYFLTEPLIACLRFCLELLVP